MERPRRRRAAAGRGWRRAGPPAACTPRVSLHTGVQLKSSYLRINNYTKQLNLSDLPSKRIRAQTQETYSSRREVVIISVVLVPDNYLARADNIWSGTR